MRNKKVLLDVPVLAVFLLSLIDMDYSNLRAMDYAIIALIIINIVLMAVYHIKRRKRDDV